MGASLALMAGPSLVHALRDALASALAWEAPSTRPSVVATAADIADVEAALASTGALTPDAALLALGRRHGNADAVELADGVLLAAALRSAPSLGRAVEYRPHPRVDHRQVGRVPEGNDDRELETPTGEASARWVTSAAQREALVGALAHHTDRTEVGLGMLSLLPLPFLRSSAEVGASSLRGATRWAARHGQDAYDDARTGLEVVGALRASDDGVPGGMLAGDVIVSWPVHRTSWRGGVVRDEPGSSRYRHVVYLRPADDGLAIVGEGRSP
jgi:hypothetical protein